MHPLKKKKNKIHDVHHPPHWKNIKKKKKRCLLRVLSGLGFVFLLSIWPVFVHTDRERERVSSQRIIIIIIMPIKHFAL